MIRNQNYLLGRDQLENVLLVLQLQYLVESEQKTVLWDQTSSSLYNLSCNEQQQKLVLHLYSKC